MAIQGARNSVFAATRGYRATPLCALTLNSLKSRTPCTPFPNASST